MAAYRPPLSDAEKQKIRELHGQNLSRNAIAKIIGCTPSTVSRYTLSVGLSFEGRTKFSAHALEANKNTLKQRTQAAHERQLRIIEYEQQRVLDHFEKGKKWPTKLRGKGGAEYIQESDEILSEDWRNIATAMANSSQTLNRLAPLESPAEEAAKSMADSLAEMLGLPKVESASESQQSTPASTPGAVHLPPEEEPPLTSSLDHNLPETEDEKAYRAEMEKRRSNRPDPMNFK